MNHIPLTATVRSPAWYCRLSLLYARWRGRPPLTHIHCSERGRFLWSNVHIILGWPLSILLLGIVLWTVMLTELNSEKAALRQEAITDVSSLSKSYAEYLARTIEHIDQLTLQVRYDWQQSGGRYRLEVPERKGIFDFRHTAAITIVDRNGMPVTSTYPFRRQLSWLGSDSYRFHHDNPSEALHIGAPMQGKLSGTTVIQMTRRISDAQGRFAGMIVASVTPEYFSSAANMPLLGEDGFQGIAGNDGVIHLIKQNDSTSWKDATLFRMPPPDTISLPSGTKGFNDSKSRYVASHPLHNYPFFAVVGMSEKMAMAHYGAHRATMRNVGIAVSIFLALFSVIAVMLSLRLAWKTHRLAVVRNTYRIATEFGNDGYYMWRARLEHDGEVADFEIVDCNERGAAMFGVPKNDLLNTLLSGVPVLEPYLNPLMHRSRLAMEHGFYEDDMVFAGTREVERVWLHMRMVRSEDGLAVTLRDISDQKEHEHELHQLANSDTLTGLPNRHWLMRHLPALLAAARQAQQTLAVLFIDMDDFKNVNDTLGHSAGDMLLQAVSRRLQSALRPGDCVARLGGDEFTLILSSISRREDVSSVAQRVIQTFTESFEIQQRTLSVGASIGISVFPQDGDDAETLLKNADIAMYAAKSEGKNTFHFYNPTLYDQIEQRLDSERELMRAIREDHFVVYYQPRVDTFSGRMIGMEALVRWMHPERGLISPDHFIPLAESTGMILELGQMVLDKVCRQLVNWLGGQLPVVPVSVNVSARQFDEGNISALIAERLKRYGLPASLIEIELTESAMRRNFDRVRREVEAISAMGIQLHVDDFGTGYSSLSLLHRLSMQVLKVDRSFTAQLCNGKGGGIFFSAIVSMAKALQMRVVAEGVETEEQLRALQQLGCDEIQGYLVARPLPADEAASLLKKMYLFAVPKALLLA